MTTKVSFEDLRAELEKLEAPLIEGDRSTYWVLPRRLGLARTVDGSIEVLIVGLKIQPRTATVRRHIEHARWEIAGTGHELDVNRLLLPPEQHFSAIAALIATELIRAGIYEERPLSDVFSDVEPIIELALRRGALDDEHILGLIGELLCLEVMLDAVLSNPEYRMPLLDMWRGHRVGQRDFSIGVAAIEVKTTSQESSSHKITGLHQVELDGAVEECLFLLSVGLAPSEHEGKTLPQLVQRLLDRLGDAGLRSDQLSPLQRRFLDDVSRFGSTVARGYDHLSMAKWKMYETRFRVTFAPRLYDLGDADIRILRRNDLVDTNVNSGDIQYGIDLQSAVNGSNPAPDWRRAICDLTRSALGLPERTQPEIQTI